MKTKHILTNQKRVMNRPLRSAGAALGRVKSPAAAALAAAPAARQRAWLGTQADGREHLYLIETEIAADAGAALRWVRDTWGFPVVAMRDQLTPAERVTAREWVGDIVSAIANLDRSSYRPAPAVGNQARG